MHKFLFLFVLAVIGIVLALEFASKGNGPLTISGTIEARAIRIGSKLGGRIAEVHMREGDRVRKGDLLIVFDAADIAAELEQAIAQRDEAAAQLARLEHGSRPEELAEARATASKSGGVRFAEVAQARAELDRAKTEFDNAERSFRRVATPRTKSALVSAQTLDDLETRWHAQQAVVRAAQHALTAAEARLTVAQAVTSRIERGFRQEDIAAGRAVLARTKALVKAIEVRYAERKVYAPIDAIVEVFDRSPGDLVAAGAILARLLEAKQLYVMVYVSESQVGKLVLGQTVNVRVASMPNLIQTGRIEQIRTEAEFLPRNIQTPEERVHQVIGVKIGLGDTDPHLHPGITATVEFVGVPL